MIDHDLIALDAAHQIEALPNDLHAAQKTARIQLIVLAAMTAALPPPQVDSGREALRHAQARFQCLADHFKEIGDETLWAMSEVDAERMEKALALRPERSGGRG